MALENFREDLKNKLDSTASIENITALLTAIKTADEIDKISVERNKTQAENDNIVYQRRVDLKKFWIGLVAPTVTSLALVVTIVVQAYYANKNYLVQNQDRENKMYIDLFSKIHSPSAKTDLSINETLKELYHSSNFKEKACEFATNYILPDTLSKNRFNSFFSDYIKIIDESNYSNLVKLTSELNMGFSVVNSNIKKDNDQLHLLQSKNPSNNGKMFSREKLDADSAIWRDLLDELKTASNGLRDFIKNRKNDKPLNLTDCVFYGDLINLNFSSSIIDNANFSSSFCINADFSNINSNDNSDWNYTPWWYAKAISKSLLKYLVTNYPYDPAIDYARKGGIDEAKNDKAQFNLWKNKLKVM